MFGFHSDNVVPWLLKLADCCLDTLLFRYDANSGQKRGVISLVVVVVVVGASKP